MRDNYLKKHVPASNIWQWYMKKKTLRGGVKFWIGNFSE